MDDTQFEVVVEKGAVIFTFSIGTSSTGYMRLTPAEARAMASALQNAAAEAAYESVGTETRQ